ncbi:hypothetical protein Q8W71_17530 [Methylobacterium sp. NEAU 140]|uniref:hypothetical protein n=1 Tax=Methylobacterium sp. NEAU 140 TaxID=3064945 RepID=UPI002734DC81|nr:hypothetical protein [Methylobacterium sp. NEAU 140]MDP4024429.1 hypothetical protein [Methylobacterium sp. NEAU 140]
MSPPINVSRTIKMRTQSRFIETHSDGTVTLKYPGWPERHYASITAALNRRRLIDLGKAKRQQGKSGQHWTREEIDIVVANWGRIPPPEWPIRLPGRTYRAVKAFALTRKIRAAADMRRLTQASNLDRKTRPRDSDWSPEEIAILYANERAIARSLLAPKRSVRAVASMASRLRLKLPLRGEPWSATEMALLRNIIRCVDALKSRHGRSARAIEHRAAKERQTQAFVASATEAVKAACASLEPAVRLEVESEVLIAVLSKAIDFAGIPAEARAARTRIYGPRHYSLDAPIGDGSMSWIDTIADDREHF